jgi:putative heme-binding domain-containing protein
MNPISETIVQLFTMKPAQSYERLLLTGRFLLLSALIAGADLHADDFSDIIRKTEPRTPQEQLKLFHLPPGFEIQLVASEPQICKPMNMAFDPKGRLWITQSREYPFPVLPVDKKGRDKVMVLEDFDGIGRARKISTFAEGLNIPIGLYPYKDGVIAFSIPKVRYFRDTDGDGKADKEQELLSGFGYEKDTHGLTSSFRRGYDGWIYADHGFHNDSTVVARDGSKIQLTSGNCYRFQPDGSHVEQFSWGQVNPFGLMFDHLGDLWSSDCHSSPTYLLLRGAYYPSFGRPNDGLGFAPMICQHSHGSTAIAGMVYYDATNFPAEFHGNTFIGNVMTCRINRDSYPETGSTRLAKEEPDFLSCDDPWFRPVDVQLGADGALYIADFYNRIIGHYEVPLDHPGRDRERGRIWRVVYTGKGITKPTHDVADSVKLPADVKGLIAELGSPNIARRNLAMTRIADEIGTKAIQPLQNVFRNKKSNGSQKANALWLLQRLGGLEEKTLLKAATDPEQVVRVHTMRVLSETHQWTPKLQVAAREALEDIDAYVKRAAADALGLHPDFQNVRPLMRLRNSVPTGDTELLHMTRMSLRNQLNAEGTLTRLQKAGLTEADSRSLADVSLGLTNREAGIFLLQHISKCEESREKLTAYLRHAARYAPASEMDSLADFTLKKFSDDIDFQLALFKSVREGLTQRGLDLPPSVLKWGGKLAEQLLASVDIKSLEWRNSPVKGVDTVNPWSWETRPCSDGQQAQLISSLAPGGESLTGILRSKAFTIPEKFSFYLAGHDGTPDQPMRKKNFARLREVDSNKVLKQAVPPRNDTAQLITWDLKDHVGKKGFLEITDGNTGRSFAWLAVGRFEPQVVTLPKVIPNEVDRRQLMAAELADSLHLTSLENDLAALLANEDINADTRAAAAKAVMSFNAKAHTPDLGKILADSTAPMKLREQVAQTLAGLNSMEANSMLVETLRVAPGSLQTQVALSLSSKAEGIEALLKSIEDGKVSARLLQERTVKDRLSAAKGANVKERIEKLTKNLAAADEQRQKIIDERRALFASSEGLASAGEQIFKNNCAVCHTIDGQGGLVGPQLDGVGNRGADRILEDILDPSRNVDGAFKTTLIIKKDGDVESGLFRREEGEVVVLAQSTGKEISIPKKDIQERRQSETSLMPDNFSELIQGDDLNNLTAFLLSKGSKPTARK